MAAKVAVEGDVSATAGTTPYTGAASGPWKPGPISYESYADLRSGGKAVIWKAECTFSFSGPAKSGSSTITGSETVTLTATARLLNGGRHSVLVDGDEETSSSYSNKLAVAASGPLSVP